VAHALEVPAPKLPFACKFCDKSYQYSNSLRLHLRAHRRHRRIRGKRMFHCTYPGCDASFPDKSNFRRHLGSHENKRNYACSLCTRRFARRASLRFHMSRVHADADPEAAPDGAGVSAGALASALAAPAPVAGPYASAAAAAAAEPAESRPELAPVAPSATAAETQ
jgi:hypothetical protein